MSSRILSLHGRSAVVECSTCLCDHTLEADGETPMLKQRLCADPFCRAPLCEVCPQFQCEVCDGVFCLAHQDASGYCAECAAVLAAEALIPDDPLPACAACGVVRKVAQSEIAAGRKVACCGEAA
jgi:hypothetical protein